MESKERLKDDFAEAQTKREFLANLPTNLLLAELQRRDVYGDHRIRMMSRDGDIRVVAPNARKSNGTLYANNLLIIEQATKDSLGNKTWAQLGDRLLDNESYSRGDTRVQLDRAQFNAIFKLLADCDR